MNEKLPIVAIIGRPNVGKSTLFNRLIGKRIAITTDIPGTTRDRLYEVVTWQGKEFILIDTAGIEFAFDERFKEDIQSQIESAVAESDFIVFMAD
ncbi:ribosome biogenesis GTPase Der, partial [bacterium (Candidatus Howlettbacteria) CG_4_10_14_0_8_um_filter_40_9]